MPPTPVHPAAGGLVAEMFIHVSVGKNYRHVNTHITYILQVWSFLALHGNAIRVLRKVFASENHMTQAHYIITYYLLSTAIFTDYCDPV